MSAEQEYEYRVHVRFDPAPGADGPPIEGATPTVTEAACGGRQYREMRAWLRESGGGGLVELQRRAVGPWEAVEAASVPAAPTVVVAPSAVGSTYGPWPHG